MPIVYIPCCAARRHNLARFYICSPVFNCKYCVCRLYIFHVVQPAGITLQDFISAALFLTVNTVCRLYIPCCAARRHNLARFYICSPVFNCKYCECRFYIFHVVQPADITLQGFISAALFLTVNTVCADFIYSMLCSPPT